jgi:Chitobiase/beta-hexosaminidase C-terminal domain
MRFIFVLSSRSTISINDYRGLAAWKPRTQCKPAFRIQVAQANIYNSLRDRGPQIRIRPSNSIEEKFMRAYLTLLTLALAVSCALAQDPGMQAAQQASQMATQAAQQATQQANDQMMQASQQANQMMMQNAMQAAQNTPPCNRCYAAKPKFSAKSGKYSSPVTLKLRDSTRGAVIYYTTDGWTPTPASTRYVGPITIDSTTTLQAIAISPYGGRSRVATAVYTLNGVPAATPAAQPAVATPETYPNSAPESAAPKLLLARDTPVPLVFDSDVNSKTADVGDKIPLTLAEDLKVGDMVVVRKGTPAVATVTEVDKTGMGGAPGEVFCQIDSIQAGGVVIKLHGTAAKEGQDKVGKAIGLMFVPVVPVGVFVHGKNAEIKQGAQFTAFVGADTLLLPAN